MLTMTKKIANKGFTFIEMMVALVINVILLAALLGVLANYINRYNQAIANDTLNQQLQVAMNFMVNDIRRAGYWSLASTNIGVSSLNSNPFMAVGTDISISGSCILFTYDHGGLGTLVSIGTGADDDRYGFLLSNNTIMARPPGAAFSCNPTAGTWENVTNPNVVAITALTFTETTTNVPAGAPAPYMTLRGITITITGHLVSNTSVTKTITEHVRVRNDKYVP